MATVAQIRLAAPADALAIACMSREYIEQGLTWSWTPARVLRVMADRTSNVVLATARGSVLGFGIMLYGEDSAHLALLAVQPAHRQQGWGGRLLDWLIEPAAALGLQQVQVEARVDNPRAIAFYERQGFERRAIIAGYYRGAIDAVRLERTLRPERVVPLTTPVRLERQGRVGVSRLSGPMNPDQVLARGSTAITLARGQRMDRLLILAAGLELLAPPDVPDRTWIGQRWAQLAGEALRVAVVAHAELIDPRKLRVLVAAHPGAQIAAFDAEPAARAWLVSR